MEEYVGGDAYNFIIEASLRGGEIAGATVSKTVCFAAAGIALVMALFAFCGKGAAVQPPAWQDEPARALLEKIEASCRPAQQDVPQEDAQPWSIPCGGQARCFRALTKPATANLPRWKCNRRQFLLSLPNALAVCSHLRLRPWVQICFPGLQAFLAPCQPPCQHTAPLCRTTPDGGSP